MHNIVTAVSLNGVIGRSDSNLMPWSIPLDLKHFKSLTVGKTVIMGTRTFDSIGRPLPNRRNVVISRDTNREFGVDTYKSLEAALSDECEHDVPFVIGGGHIYAEALRLKPSTIFVTIIDENIDGDVYFPITGKTFKESYKIKTPYGDEYSCSWRFDWIKDNNHNIQFARFDRMI